MRGSKYHYWRAIYMAICGRDFESWLRSFVIVQGIWTSIANKPYIFVIFHRRGGGGGVLIPCPSRWIRACVR